MPEDTSFSRKTPQSEAGGTFPCVAGQAWSPACANAGQELLTKASEYFVGLKARSGEALELEVAAWLEQSPCHRCAWRRIESLWDDLAAAMRRN